MTAAVDFLRPESPPRLGWMLLAIGAVGLAAALGFDSRVDAARVEAERVARVQAEQERDARRPARPVAPTPTMIRLRQAEMDARAPWLATLRAVESAALDPVYLRSLTIEPATGAVKLVAEAPSFGEALAFAKVLDEEGVLRPALLNSHEQIVDGATGQPAVRFAVSGRWNPL